MNKEINIFYSVFLENDGKGNFNMLKLPWQAQMAPIQDIEFADLDGDEKDEVFVVGDLFNVEVETVRYDASTGAILKWTGTEFICMDRKETGFVGTGDARKIEVIDQPGGKQIIVLANNNGPIETFVK